MTHDIIITRDGNIRGAYQMLRSALQTPPHPPPLCDWSPAWLPRALVGNLLIGNSERGLFSVMSAFQFTGRAPASWTWKQI